MPFDKVKTSMARIIQKKSRYFQPDWLEKNGWLSYCKTENKINCQTCRYVFSAGLKKVVDAHGANAFMSKGFTNWRTASEQFSQNAKSAFHTDCNWLHCQQQGAKPIDEQLTSIYQNYQKGQFSGAREQTGRAPR